jgi:hypothetical protein
LEQIWPPVQAFPQEPQLLASVCRFTQLVPQSVVPLGQTQLPLEQIAPPVQALPQVPQLYESLLRSVQVPLPQFAEPAGQQIPLEQTWPLPHAGPFPQVQVPAVHVSAVPLQATPHFPQFWVSLVRSTHAPPQFVWPVGQHIPLEQTWPAPQAGPDPHVQAPPEQLSVVPAQAMPHLPQFWALLVKSTQAPPQFVWPVGQHLPFEQTWPLPQAGPAPQVQVPAVQVSVVPVQTTPHPPQLLLSVWVLTQRVPQSVWPLGQLATHVPLEQIW